MFLIDEPIQNFDEDLLGRKEFSKKLGQSLLSWDEHESLVVALYGKWGSGKSSIINLALEEIKNNDTGLNIFIFNPWIFSSSQNIEKTFFEELAKVFQLYDKSDKDQKIAQKIRKYSSLLGLIPNKVDLSGFYKTSLLFLTASIFTNYVSIIKNFVQNNKILSFVASDIFPIIVAFLFVCGLGSKYLKKVYEYIQNRNESWSIQDYKEKIQKAISSKKKKLLIVIDDIDRLSSTEMRQIFKIVRLNADFQNTIYLLSFDRNIIEKNLDEQPGVSGKDFLEKIIQVNFEVPFAKKEVISKFLFQELDRIIQKLPNVDKFFDQTHWGNIYHAGLKEFFTDIRSIKRFVSSLEFNLSLLHKQDVLEVNPIDFIAIEAFRIFVPDFYKFMNGRSELFTETEKESRSGEKKKERKLQIETALKDFTKKDQNQNVLKVLLELFPQLNGIFENTSYGSDWISSWQKKLRIAAPQMYDCYFSLIPGGDESEIGEYELKSFIDKAENLVDLENSLKSYISNGKIRKLLSKIQTVTDNNEIFTELKRTNLIQALFNVSDTLPDNREGMFDFGSMMDVMRIVYQLLKTNDKKNNFEILKECILNSKSISAPLRKVSYERPDDDKTSSALIEKENFQDLVNLCLSKIEDLKTSNELLHNSHCVSALYFWNEYGKKEEVKSFIDNVIESDAGLVEFLKNFIDVGFSHSASDYVSKSKKIFGYKNLKDFYDIELIEKRLISMKSKNTTDYLENKETIDFIITEIDKSKKGSVFDQFDE